jgi:predicted alpha-1,2-mannosidase
MSGNSGPVASASGILLTLIRPGFLCGFRALLDESFIPSRSFSMKRVLKWVVILLVFVLSLPIVAALAAYGYHYSIVSAGPGTLPGAPEPTGLAAKTDLFIGTGGFPWMSALNSVAACVPFGMVRLGPDTQSWFIDARNLNRSGYHYGDNEIIGFSHNRLVGADSKEGGAFRVFPTTAGRMEGDRGAGRTVKFSHADERVFPGYYGVQLANGVKAEMTTTTRTGTHRYTFPAGEAPILLLDVGSALAVDDKPEDDREPTKNEQAVIDRAANEITGSMTTFGSFSGRYDGLDVYFCARPSVPFAEGTKDLDENHVLELHFAAGAPVELRVALSYVSIANARANLDAETTGKTFEGMVGDAVAAWNGIFDRIKIAGATAEQERIFYTAMQRAFVMPTTFNDVNGQYTGFDKQVHVAEGFTYYTDFSIWDTFRTVHPLYTLIAPREHTDMMKSLTAMAVQGGALPRWPSGAGYTNCMFGTPADMLVSEAYLKGIRDFDVETAYNAARQTALVGVPEGSRFAGRQGLQEYLQYGYCPSDKVEESVACTIDYSWCDYSLAGWATALGKTEDAAIFARNAESYKKMWNPETLFFQGRDSQGNFEPNFKPLKLTYTDPDKKYTRAYVEGSAMQWRWGGPYDPAGLIGLWPSEELFVEELSKYIENSRTRVGWWNPGGNYWHGNEPFIHAAYLFNSTKRPDLAQRYVRRIINTKYKDTYYGLDGNDDGGTLSSWYVFSALGFYPVAGTTRYELVAPLFTKAEINLGNGKILTVNAKDASIPNYYVHEKRVNGEKIEGWTITHDQIKDGGTLDFDVSKDRPGVRKPPIPLE